MRTRCDTTISCSTSALLRMIAKAALPRIKLRVLSNRKYFTEMFLPQNAAATTATASISASQSGGAAHDCVDSGTFLARAQHVEVEV